LQSHRGVGGDWFLRELGWREFSHHLIFHFPQTPEHNLDPKFDQFPWARHNAKAISRWQRGRTGIPMVDAGMRQLWTTGWMHNRVRMLVASFLTKNLRQHWLEGARWFWETLVDADLANNTQGWQWTAGSGADAAPYFRIFNPVTQGKRFDPNGDYVRRWVPELKRVSRKLVHEPWLDSDVLKKTKYPAPLVDLGQSRTVALAAFQKMRRKIR
jgi:deoxyribodipyrimidine photo-lyase